MANLPEKKLEFTREDMEFAGQIMSNMSQDASSMANALDNQRLREIEAWKKKFSMLYHSMKKVAERTDSRTAFDALERFDFDYGMAVAEDNRVTAEQLNKLNY